MNSTWGRFDQGSASVRVLVHSVFGWAIVLLLCATSQVLSQDAIDESFGFEDINWQASGSFTFPNQLAGVDGAANSWGNAEGLDIYGETGTSLGQSDFFVPGEVTEDGLVVISYDMRYRTIDGYHNYLSFGNDDAPENAIWLGVGGGQFWAGTGSEFQLGSAAQPAGVAVEYANSATPYADDTRIRVRMGYDVAAQTLSNLQVDADRDGRFESELLAGEIDVSAANLEVADWFLVNFYGQQEARADDVRVQQYSRHGDYNRDLDFNEKDADLICSGIATGDLAFDYSGDGVLDATDTTNFAFDKGSLVADTNFDGAVNFADFLTMSSNFQKAGSWTSGDFTCDGVVQFGDFLILSTFFGSQAAQPVGPVANIPEPNSAALLWLAVSCCAICRVRRQSTAC